MDLLDREFSNVRVQCRQCPCIPLETSLVLVFLQESGGRFSEDAWLANAKEPCGSYLLESSRENRYGLRRSLVPVLSQMRVP